MAIDISNISFINYLWTKKNSDGTLTGIRLSKNNLPTDTIYSSLTNIDRAIPVFSGVNSNNLKATGVTISDANLLSAPMIGTGSGDNNYFQSRKFRGEGNAATYYHAVDFGFAGHNQVDFYEYGGLWNFWKNTEASATTAASNLCLQIGDTYVKNKGNTFTWPTTGGTLALTSNIPTALKNPNKLSFGSKTYDGSSAQTITASDLGALTSHQDISGKVNKSGDTMTGNLTPATNKGASLGTSSLYWSNIYGTTIYENGTSLANKYASKTNLPEAYLTWGGKNFSGSYGPIDAAMVPELGANRLAFMPANAVTIEYSRDGGATWTDYGAADYQKIGLFNGIGSGFTIGKASSGAGNIATNKYQLRVNIYTGTGRVYTVLNKFVIYLSTSGTNNNWCTIRARTQSDYTAGNDKWTTFADKISVSGWSGYNVINTSGITTYGNTASTQYGHIQFIFGCDTGSTNNSYSGLTINKIFGFGGVGWNTPSTMAKTGHMYTYDSSQNVTFPAGVSATSFTEGGTSLSNKYLGKTAKAADADKLDGKDSTYYINYNNLTNKPTIPAAANNGTITIKQKGVSDQTFTVNQSNNTTITLVDTWRPLGTGASDACAGNDARLSNARTPTAHTHTSNDVTDALTLIQGNNITLTPTASGLEISAAADGKVKTVNNQQPDSNGNVQLTAANVGARASDWMPTAAQVGALANNASVVYYTAQTLTNEQKTQARTNMGAGTITEIKVNGTSKGTSGSVNLTNMVTFASSQTATVAGTSKTTYTYNQPTGDSNTGSSNGSAYFPEGIIMGGTAASAGLVTRGICGVTTPDATTGACSKENLYINYDGDNNNNPNGRGLVINAGSSGSDLGNGVYSYCAVRGDAMKAYCDNHYATKSSLSNTNSNVVKLQGYFRSGIANKAKADKNGNDITTEYVHARVEAGPKASIISHQTTPSDARVGIYAEDGNYGGASVYASTYGTVLNYTASGGQNSCALELTETGATLEFDESGTQYSIITTKDTATANNVGVIKAAAVRTSAITTTQGGTTSGRYYGVELDSNGKAFVNVPWTDNNTTYSAGTGLSLSGTTFSANTSLGLINSSSSNLFDIYRLSGSSYRLKIIRGSHTFSFSNATGFPGGSITFPNSTSMPSSNYHVIAWSSNKDNVDVYQIKTFSKATTGFQIITRAYSSTKSFSVEYLAICTV